MKDNPVLCFTFYILFHPDCRLVFGTSFTVWCIEFDPRGIYQCLYIDV